jgi:hypothetical protein
MEYLVSTNLNILNKGNEPTYVISNRKVTHLTLVTSKIGDLVTNWHVCDEISLSNDTHQVLQLCDLDVARPEYHNPKRTNLNPIRKA